mmetsp:Transcript_17574/g.28900  ORF Transcript_17574/g.28900 Transcript_17574/m.28900 type:complete len:158 (-) Transcript_17574:1148-1621(-)
MQLQNKFSLRSSLWSRSKRLSFATRLTVVVGGTRGDISRLFDENESIDIDRHRKEEGHCYRSNDPPYHRADVSSVNIISRGEVIITVENNVQIGIGIDGHLGIVIKRHHVVMIIDGTTKIVLTLLHQRYHAAVRYCVSLGTVVCMAINNRWYLLLSL